MLVHRLRRWTNIAPSCLLDWLSHRRVFCRDLIVTSCGQGDHTAKPNLWSMGEIFRQEIPSESSESLM